MIPQSRARRRTPSKWTSGTCFAAIIPRFWEVPVRCMGDPRLRGKIAAVTGGGRGLGRALVEALAAEGADVAFSYRESRAGAEQQAEALRKAGRRVFVSPADARAPGEMAGFVEAAAQALGGLDVLVNNVGVSRKVPFESLSEDLLDEAFDVNVKAAGMAAQAAAPHMRRRGEGGVG